MWENIAGIALILLGAWQVYLSFRFRHTLTRRTDPNAATFSPFGLAYSFFIGLVFAGMGVALLLGAF